MKKQVVRAGKYLSVGILFIACLPVLLPLLFFLSIFGFTFVLPLGCALAGFLFLRKYVGMLYRKLQLPSIAIGGCASWGRRRPPLPGVHPHPNSPLFIDLPVTDQQAILTFQSIDREFDAVVISTAPREQRGPVGDADIWSELEAVSVSAAVSTDDANRPESVDDEKIVEITTNRGGADDDDTSKKDSTKEGSDDVVSTENRTGTEGAAADDVAGENWTIKKEIDVPTSARKGTREWGIDDDASTESRTGTEGADEDIPVENWTVTEGIDDSTSAENGTRREGADGYNSPQIGTKREIGEDAVPGGDASDKDANGRAGIDEARGGVRDGDEFSNDRTGTKGTDRPSVDETGGHAPGVDNSARHVTFTEWKDITHIEDGNRIERKHKDGETQEEEESVNEERVETTMPRAPKNDDTSSEVPDGIGFTSGAKETEEKSDKDEVQSKPDFSVHHEAAEEEERTEGVKKLSEETYQQKFEAVGNKHGKLDITPDTFHDASEHESPTKPDGIGKRLPHQANEDDIWICRECGWKYPNAKPSAKIRRNHKKHCRGSSPKSPPPDDGIQWDRLSQHNDGVAELRNDSKPSVSHADPGTKEMGEGVIRQSSHAELDIPSPAEDEAITWSDEHQSKGGDLDTGGVSISAESVKHDEESGAANEFRSMTSESFHSAPDEFPQDRWASFPSVEGHYDDEEDQLAQVQHELQLCDELNAVKGVVGDTHVSTGPLLTDIEELSQVLGIDLPVRGPDMPEIEWAKLSIEVMKVVVGID
ncbi:unnamed protein product [Calypogeia fissa]